MWEKIETSETIFKIQVGDKVSQNPNDPLSEFVTKVIRNGYISIVGGKSKNFVRLLPLDLLVRDNWWTKP
jgi:Na+-transporting NADH:ubiquinone oxidoreductase subunit NqrF